MFTIPIGKGEIAHQAADPSVTLIRSQRIEGHLFLSQQPKDILTLKSSNIKGTFFFATTLLDLAR